MTFGSTAALPQLGVARERLGQRAALGLVLALTVATVMAVAGGAAPWPRVSAFLPICATLWSTAELLTAFLLFAQFYVAGRLAYAVLAAAYSLSGILTIPYLAAFPGIFYHAAPAPGALQISAWLWVSWHCAFPVLIALTHLLDPSLERRVVVRSAIVPVLTSIGVLVVSAALSVTAVVVLAADRLLPLIAPGGRFTPTYSSVIAPAVVICNIGALAAIAARVRRLTRLHVWIAVALLASAYDGILNAFAPARYTAAWYVGKFEALLTASVVLLMLLVEIATLYRRLFDAASLDPLTGLSNRRRLDEEMRSVLRGRAGGGVAMLVIDVDHFKAFNDRNGHVRGDEALRSVADVLRRVAYRRSDVVARSGGEEFIIVLPGVTFESARSIAERVRRSVDVARIGSDVGGTTHVTISVGLSYASDARGASTEALYAAADGALYMAKAAGRNRVEWAPEDEHPAFERRRTSTA